MNRKEINDLLKKKDEELTPLVFIDQHSLENLISQRDNSLAQKDRTEKDCNNLIKETKKEMEDLREQRAQELAGEREPLQLEIAKRDKTIEELTQQLKEAQSLIDSLGGTEQGIKMRKELHKKTLKEEIDIASKKLKELDD